MLLEQTIEVRHLQAGTGGDTALARAVDDVRIAALLRRHRVDQRLELAKLLFGPRSLGHLGHLPHARQLAHQATHAAHLLELLELFAEVLEIEALAFLDLLGELFGLALVDGTLGFLDQRQHVAHAEDARGHTIRMEGLEGIDLLADTHELDRTTGDVTHRQGGTATGITVGLGQHYPGQWQGIGEGAGGVGRILAGHGVDHKQRFGGLDGLMQPLDLLHHRFVDGQATCGIDQYHVMELDLGVFQRRRGDVHRGLIRARREEVDLDLLGQGLELVDGGGAVDVGGNHQHLLLFALAQILAQLGHRGGLARTLQAGHQHHGGRALERQPFVGLAHGDFQLLLDNLDELLARRQAAGDLLAHGTFAHSLDERLDHRQGNVRLEQRLAHLAQGVLDVVVGQACLTLDRLQRLGQTLAQVLKHGPLQMRWPQGALVETPLETAAGARP